jgi:type I restriction enzyme M protein
MDPHGLDLRPRTNKHFTLKTNTLTRADLDDFVRCYRYKANLDIFWLRDDSLGDSSDLPDPAVLATEIVEDLQAALDQFAQIAAGAASPGSWGVV